MKWLGRLLKKRPPQLRFPAGQTLSFWVIDPQHETAIQIRSRSHPGHFFEVRLDKLHCTCPGFRNERSQYAIRELRRVCPHILEAVKIADLEISAHPLMMLVARHGRKFREFYRMRVEAANADVVFGFKPDDPRIAVFALINNHEQVQGSFHLAEDAWLKPPEKYERVLVGAIHKTFHAKPGETAAKN